MILLAENVAFGTSSKMKATFYYEKQRNGSTMKYRIKTTITMPSGYSFGYNINQKITMDGVLKETYQIKANSPSKWDKQEYTTGWFDVTNKTSGTTSLVINLSSNSGLNTNYTYSMGVDPAYTSITLFGVYDQTETSITYSWETADIISKLEYSFNNVNWTTYSNDVNSKSGRFTITGLTADTSYNMYIRVTRKDSGLQTTSNALTDSTLMNPQALNLQNFVIGDIIKVNFYNILRRLCKIYLVIQNGESILIETTIPDSIIYEIDSNLYADKLKQASPNSDKNKYSIKVICEEINSNVTSSQAEYTITNKPPEFEDFEYLDSSDVALITENNQEIVKNKSILKVKISSENKMIAKDYATAIRYEISCSNRTKSVNYSEEDIEIELGTINSAGIMNIVVKAIDSRGFTTTLNKTINVIDYTNIVQHNDVYRINNFENETKLKCEGTFSLVEINGAAKNVIEEIKYRYKESGGDYGNYISIPVNLNGNKYACVLQTFDLDNQKSFIFEVLACDKFGWSEAVELVVDEGVPIMYLNADKKNIGIGCINEKEEYSLKVLGKIYANNDIILKSDKPLELEPTLLYDGYITPNDGVINIGSIKDYERLLIVLGANGSYTTKEIPKNLFNSSIGVNWQAVDNRLAMYYCTFMINENGDVEVKWSGYTLANTNEDYIRYYGISMIYGYKY